MENVHGQLISVILMMDQPVWTMQEQQVNAGVISVMQQVRVQKHIIVMKETPSSDISYLHSMVSQFENAGFEPDPIPVVFDIKDYISVSDRMIKDMAIRKRAGAVYLKSHLDAVSGKEGSDFLGVLMKIVKKNGMVLS